MRYYLKKKQYKVGDLKQFIKFAWFPKKVEDHIIWLECYKSMCEMVEHVDQNYLNRKVFWREYDRRLMDNYGC